MKPYDFPLQMSAPMVLALLRQVRDEPGGKTQTRRFETPILRAAERAQAEGRPLRAWVRETFAYVGSTDPGFLLFKASGYLEECARYGFDRPYPPESEMRWKPAIHMPRRASRLTLLDVSIRRERLGDISEDDARAEGIIPYQGQRKTGIDRFLKPYLCPVTGDPRYETARDAYVALWDQLHGESSFVDNADETVMVITFRPMLANIDKLGAEHA